MSCTVGTDATTPRLSWMFGPVGADGGCGAGPRLVLMNAQSSELPSPMNEHGAPNTELSCAGVTAFACPVAVSPIHSSTPLSRMFVNAKRLPSALNPIQVITGDGGRVTLRSLPSAMTFSVRLRYRRPRCG